MMTSDSASKLSALRSEMAQAGYDAFLVPMADAYQSEYVPDSDRRIAFLTGFTGSAGFVIVLKDRAAFFTDSRYTLQATHQVASDLFSVFDSGLKPPTKWIEENLAKGMKVAYDPWLHSAAGIERLKKSLTAIEAVAVPAPRNLIDIIWQDKPAEPCARIVAHDLTFAGQASYAKRQAVGEALKKKNFAAAVICDPCSIAWLLNVRGGDVPNAPLPLSRAIIALDGKVLWFADPRKTTPDLLSFVGADVAVHAPDDFVPALEALARHGGTIVLDPEAAASRIVDVLREAGGKVEFGDDPCELPRAIKNPAELDGMRAAHRRDGASLTRFLAWLDRSWRTETLTELSVEAKLTALRAENINYRGPSFDTIAGAGEHGAIVHYRATTESDARLKAGQLFLLDSGAQYLDGTTDVTRTVALGSPSPEMRENFTRVLKGHIALSSIKFPEGTTGSELDVLARQYLWEQGLDYGHGTGHGVGCYLGVHEGPQAISKRNKTILQPGMIVSNEPGFYKAGHYGIRIENLMAVVEIVGFTVSERRFFGFEPLTLAPIDRSVIDVSLLTAAEIKWLNNYHSRVCNVLRPMVDGETAEWLEAITAPIEG